VAKDIETYLKELQAAMASTGADPALVQDALFDAEEHMRAEMAVGGVVGRGTATYETRFAAVVEGYGSPEEVAAAYLGTAPVHETAPAIGGPSVGEAAPAVEAGATAGAEATAVREAVVQVPGEVPPAAPSAIPGAFGAPPVAPGAPVAPTPPFAPAPAAAPTPAGVQAGMAAAAAGAQAQPSVLHQIFGVFADPAVYKALLYMLLSLITGVVYFTIVVTGLSTAGGMLVMIVGIPLLLAVLGIVRAMALFEGRLVELLLGTRMPRRPRSEPPGAGFFQRMWFWVKDGRTWASMAYMVLMLPLGIVYFTVAVTGLATAVGLITSPLWAWAGWVGDHTFIYEGVAYDWWLPVWGIPLAVIGGALLLIGMMHLIRWIGRGHAMFAKAMLVRLSK
jgi:hypothetical protein